MADEKSSFSARVIDAKFDKAKPLRGFKFYFRWLVFILVIIASVAIYFSYKSNFSTEKRDVKLAKPNPDRDYAFANRNVKESPPPPPPVAQEAKPQEQTLNSNEIISDLNEVNKRLDTLEEKNDNLIIYLAVIDLKDSLNNPESFKSALEALQIAAEDIPEFTGRLDILDQASKNGLVTNEKLSADLLKVKQQLINTNAGFSENIKHVLGDLVKVTKISGEVNKDDYNSIIKRVELQLAKGNLSITNLDVIIKETELIGKPAENFVREANNLKRVLEVTDSLSASAKQRLAE